MNFIKILDRVMKYYAVVKGRNIGIFTTWEECRKSVIGFKGAEYKSFSTKEEAEKYFKEKVKPIVEEKIYVKQDFDIFNGDEEELIEKRKKENDFTKYVVVYTDGSCLNNGKGGATGGIGVFFGDGDKRNVSMKINEEKPTNQRAEILAAITALEIVKNEPLEIRTDSMYLIKAVTDWSVDWRKRNWKTSKNEPVQNLDLFKKLFDLIDERKEKVKWTYVPGHKGFYGNEKANLLAIQGASK